MADKDPKVYGIKPKVTKEEKQAVEKYDFCFNLVTRDGKTTVCVANFPVSNKVFDTIKEAKAYIDSKPWELLVAAIGTAYDIVHNVELKK